MKILVLQLARLGDIYMSWPALRALRRQHPQAEIHLLTRPRFEGAVRGLDAIDQHLSLPAAHILEPLVQSESDSSLALGRMGDFLNEIEKNQYDLIVNLTFSPFSSYLTHYLTGLTTEVLGYTRHADGYLNLADEVSQYFYSQVGVDRWNRVHIADVFASMLGVEFIEEDWQAPRITSSLLPDLVLPESYLVIHVGASENQKSLSPDKWAHMISYLGERKSKVAIVLIGAANEKHIAQNILTNLAELQNESNLRSPAVRIAHAEVLDLVGRTQIQDLFPLIEKAIMLIGCDSAPIHIASLTDTATLNISLGQVNFWETGPKATNSYIYRVPNAERLVAQRVGEMVAMLLEGEVAPELITRAAGLVSYAKTETAQERFCWELCQAIYLGNPFPVSENLRFYEAVMKLEDINRFILEQLDLYQTRGAQVNETIRGILDRADEIIQSISHLVSDVRPIVSWYQAEKVRIPPGTGAEVVASTIHIHRTLDRLLKVYIPVDEKNETGNHAAGAEHGKI